MYINTQPTIYPLPANLTTTVSASAGVNYTYNVYGTLPNMPLPPESDPIERVIIEPILASEANFLTAEAKRLLGTTTGVPVPEGAVALYVPKQKVDWSDVALIDAHGEEVPFTFEAAHGWLWMMAEAVFPLEFAYKALPVYQPSTWIQDPWHQSFGPVYIPYGSPSGNPYVGSGSSLAAPTAGGYVPVTSTSVSYGINQPISTSVTYTTPEGTTNTVVSLADWVAQKNTTPESTMSPE